MKKLLSVLGVVVIFGSSSSTVISCGTDSSSTPNWDDKLVSERIKQLINTEVVISTTTPGSKVTINDVTNTISKYLGISNSFNNHLSHYQIQVNNKTFIPTQTIKDEPTNTTVAQDGSLIFCVENLNNKQKLIVNHQEQFAVKFITSDAAQERDRHRASLNPDDFKYNLATALNQYETSFNWAAPNGTLLPFKDLIDGLLNSPTIGKLIPFIKIFQNLEPAILNITLDTIAQIINSVMNDANDDLVDLIPAKISAPNDKGGFDNRVWNRFLHYLESLIKNVFPDFKIDQPLISSPIEIKISILTLTIKDLNLKQLLTGIAPDIIHFVNYTKMQMRKGINNLSLIALKYLIEPKQNNDELGDNFNLVNANVEFIQNNGINFLADLLGLNSVSTTNPASGWIYKTDSHVSQYQTSSIELYNGTSLITLESINAVIPVAQILKNVTNSIMNVPDIAKYSVSIIMGQSLKANFTSLWFDILKEYLQQWHLDPAVLQFANTDKQKNSSVVQVYNYQNKGDWEDVTTILGQTAKSDNPDYLKLFMDAHINSWRVKCTMPSIAITNTDINQTYNYKNQVFYLPLI